jgi:hypothetical protein
VAALLLTARGGGGGVFAGRGFGSIRRIEGPDTLNPVDDGPANTNGAAQNGLETIMMLGLVGDALPAELPPTSEGGFVRGRRGGRDFRAPPAGTNN